MIIYTDRFPRVLSKSNAWQSNCFSFSVFDYKNHFHFLSLNNFLFKHKISEQYIHPKVSPLQRFQEEGKMKEKRGEKEREPLPDATPWHFWNRGFPNLTRYQNEVQSHVLLIFLLIASFKNCHRNIGTKPGHKSSAKFPTFHKVKCWFG